MPEWFEAGLWGSVAGAALVIGALVGYYLKLSSRFIALIMAFGAGVLVSALAFDLMDEAVSQGGILASSGGFLGGALVYTVANLWLERRGAKHRKRSGKQQKSESQQAGSGNAIALGALLDGIPESIAIGTSMLEGGAVSIVAVAAIFLSNIPEGLSSAAGMKQAGRGPGYVFGLWGTLVVLFGLASFGGYTVFGQLPPEAVAASTATAAGAILAMLADTMIPEAFDEAHDYTGLVTVLGFLAAFALSRGL